MNAAITALVTEYRNELRSHTRYVPPSSVRISNRPRTLSTKWFSSANHSPNPLKRSLVCLVEATISQNSGSAK